MAEEFPYEDIVNLPPHKSSKYPRPTPSERAARFAPFAAITGYEEMVAEEIRSTDKKIEFDETRKAEINEKLGLLADFADENTEVTVTYFEPDKRKDGGAVREISGTVKRIDEYERKILFSNGAFIDFDSIYEIESDIFSSHDPE